MRRHAEAQLHFPDQQRAFEISTISCSRMILPPTHSTDSLIDVKLYTRNSGEPNWLRTAAHMWCSLRYRPQSIPRTCTYNLFPHGTPIGENLGFPAIKVTLIRQVSRYCSLCLKINTHEAPHGTRRSWIYFVCVGFQVCGWQKQENPQLELHGWRRHYKGEV